MNRRILLIHPEAELLGELTVALARVGFLPALVTTATAGIAAIQTEKPRLVVTEVAFADLGEWELCRFLRADRAAEGIPFIFLSRRSDEIDRVLGLELDAEDYITVPFSVREVVLRIRKVIDRTTVRAGEENVMSFDELSIDVGRRCVSVAGRPLALTRKEFLLLVALAQRGDELQTRETLLHHVWATDTSITPRTIDTHVRNLRRKLGPAARFIETLRCLGYRFAARSPRARISQPRAA